MQKEGLIHTIDYFYYLNVDFDVRLLYQLMDRSNPPARKKKEKPNISFFYYYYMSICKKVREYYASTRCYGQLLSFFLMSHSNHFSNNFPKYYSRFHSETSGRQTFNPFINSQDEDMIDHQDKFGASLLHPPPWPPPTGIHLQIM